jgi:hypothetical protein
MIKNVYITRITNGEKQYGFGVTEDDEQVYIPGSIVALFELGEDDIGTKNKMSLIDDKSEKDTAKYVAVALLVEDSALQQAYEWAKEEIERLEGLLKENGVEY